MQTNNFKQLKLGMEKALRYDCGQYSFDRALLEAKGWALQKRTLGLTKDQKKELFQKYKNHKLKNWNNMKLTGNKPEWRIMAEKILRKLDKKYLKKLTADNIRNIFIAALDGELESHLTRKNKIKYYVVMKIQEIINS